MKYDLFCTICNKTSARICMNESEIILSVKRGEHGTTQVYLPLSATGTVNCYMGDTTQFVFNNGTVGTITA